MFSMNSYKHLLPGKPYTLWLLIACLLYLLFFANADIFTTRSWREFWDLGHIPLFVFIGYWIYRLKPYLQTKTLVLQLLILLVIGSLTGGAIELLQKLTERQASLSDLMLDLVGISFSLVLFSRKVATLKLHLKLGLYGICLALLMIVLWKPVNMVLEEVSAYQTFPVLAEFENDRELSAWTGNASYQLSKEFVREGDYSLKVTLKKKRYSGVELIYFPRDWSDYTHLQLYVYNESTRLFPLHISVYDRHHKKIDFPYLDRFTGRYEIKPGWNEVRIAIDQIEHAPKKRLMDMTDIQGLRLFRINGQAGKTFYLDSIRLIRE